VIDQQFKDKISTFLTENMGNKITLALARGLFSQIDEILAAAIQHDRGAQAQLNAQREAEAAAKLSTGDQAETV